MRRRVEENSYQSERRGLLYSTRMYQSPFLPQRERRYEPREWARISALERAIQRERAANEARVWDKLEIRTRLDVRDDDESDEPFYTDRVKWRALRARRLISKQAADKESRLYEEREAENLRCGSEAFLVRRMGEMQGLQEELQAHRQG